MLTHVLHPASCKALSAASRFFHGADPSILVKIAGKTAAAVMDGFEKVRNTSARSSVMYSRA